MKVYRGVRIDHGGAVIVEDNGESGSLDPRHDVCCHSASGFDWGYSGSGPAQLALALAADVLGDDERAERVHQQLKFKLIGGLSAEGWVLTEERIRAVIEAIEYQAERRR